VDCVINEFYSKPDDSEGVVIDDVVIKYVSTTSIMRAKKCFIFVIDMEIAGSPMQKGVSPIMSRQ
jgi:hypothetical protein